MTYGSCNGGSASFVDGCQAYTDAIAEQVECDRESPE